MQTQKCLGTTGEWNCNSPSSLHPTVPAPGMFRVLRSCTGSQTQRAAGCSRGSRGTLFIQMEGERKEAKPSPPYTILSPLYTLGSPSRTLPANGKSVHMQSMQSQSNQVEGHIVPQDESSSCSIGVVCVSSGHPVVSTSLTCFAQQPALP